MKNLTVERIAHVCRGSYFGDDSLLSKEAKGITIDSRKAEPDFIFVAIDGERINSHQFIPDTMKKGALCAISQENLGAVDFPYILVASTAQALLDIARLYRESFDLKVVGISGSVGKTSTKEMIASILSRKYNVHKTQGNFNNEWGLPLTVFEMNELHEVSVLEMGINHFGEMRKLSTVAQPDVCILTNIGVAHLEFLKTQEGILQEKSEMFRDMKHGGTIILNGDDPLLLGLEGMKGTKPLFYGTSPHCDIYADEIVSRGLQGTSCCIHLPSGVIPCLIPTPGIHMVSNALAGASAGYVLGLSLGEIKEGIEHLPPMPGRNHIIRTEKLNIIDDCYNANPISTKAAIDVLQTAIGRKIAILGDMGELGQEEAALHYSVGEYAGQCGIDLLYGIGRLAKNIVEGAEFDGSCTKALWFESREAFLSQIHTLIKPGDNILIKASHSMDFPEIVAALKEL